MKATRMEFTVEYADGSVEFSVELDCDAGKVRFTEYGSDDVTLALWRLPWLLGALEEFMAHVEESDLNEPTEPTYD